MLSRRKPIIVSILLISLLCGLGGASWYLWQGQWYETTENAALTGNLVEVSAQIGGSVVWIGVEQNDPVASGQVILRLDDGDAVETLSLREQELALAVQEVMALHAQVDRLDAERRLRATTHELTIDEFQRRKRLFTKNMVSEEELDAAETRQKETLGMLETALLAHREARIRAGNFVLAEHPRVLAAAARLRTSYRDWRKTLLVAPLEGEVARRRVQAGQRIQAGKSLFSVADRRNAWVEANFKEYQLRHIRPGQPVEMYSDLYGESIALAGRVASIGTGTGAVFSLLPPQNATGNWIKIVQRVPVRIELEAGFDPAHPLPFGSSFHVRIDTHDRSGPPLTPRNGTDPVVDTGVYAYQEEGAAELVANIIAAASKSVNSTATVHVPN
jgi:membrane fusion protein (multidrug efflux system)